MQSQAPGHERPVIAVITRTTAVSHLQSDQKITGSKDNAEITNHRLSSASGIPVTIIKTRTTGSSDIQVEKTKVYLQKRLGLSTIMVSRTKKTISQRQELGGINYAHRIFDPLHEKTPMGTLTIFKNLCGSDSLNNLLIVTTDWDSIGTEEGHRLEKLLIEGTFRALMEAGARVIRYDKGWGFDLPTLAKVIVKLVEAHRLRAQLTENWARLGRRVEQLWMRIEEMNRKAETAENTFAMLRHVIDSVGEKAYCDHYPEGRANRELKKLDEEIAGHSYGLGRRLRELEKKVIVRRIPYHRIDEVYRDLTRYLDRRTYLEGMSRGVVEELMDAGNLAEEELTTLREEKRGVCKVERAVEVVEAEAEAQGGELEKMRESLEEAQRITGIVLAIIAMTKRKADELVDQRQVNLVKLPVPHPTFYGPTAHFTETKTIQEEERIHREHQRKLRETHAQRQKDRATPSDIPQSIPRNAPFLPPFTTPAQFLSQLVYGTAASQSEISSGSAHFQNTPTDLFRLGLSTELEQKSLLHRDNSGKWSYW